MAMAWRVTRIGLISYLVVVVWMMFLERSIVFIPSKYPAGEWEPRGLAVEDAEFVAADGTRLHGWYVEHPAPRVHILFAHGNAGNVTNRAEQIRRMRDRLAASVMVFDYRGFGRSEGKPDEAGILQDGRAARAWLAERAGIEEQEIVLLGRSLGGGVVVDLAAKDGAAGLILQSTFTTLPDAAAFHFPWLPTRWVMRTRLNSIQKIDRYNGPLLMSHGTADTVIPYSLGEQLFEASKSREKKFVSIDPGGHNDPHPESYYDELDAFITRVNGFSGQVSE